jgi:Protein of unknown function (DUF2891)
MRASLRDSLQRAVQTDSLLVAIQRTHRCTGGRRADDARTTKARRWRTTMARRTTVQQRATGQGHGRLQSQATVGLTHGAVNIVTIGPASPNGDNGSPSPAYARGVIDTQLASRLACMPLAHLRRELPHKLDHLVLAEADLRRPRELHPAFYGCFDWHSAVHGHWMLARLARIVPGLAELGAIHALFDETLTVENLRVEAEYFEHRPAFERTYGWAWFLELARELAGTRWAPALQPVVAVIVAGYRAFLPKQTYPIRSGVHANTAFGMAFALDWARAACHRELESLLVERARTYYGADVAAPAAWEPGGEDFLSPTLIEADLMRRVLTATELTAWIRGFLPEPPRGLCEPAIVTDRSDPKLAHLDGLNLSRAWCMRSLAAALPDDVPLRAQLAMAAVSHARAGLANVATGNYAGEHWLASFAVYMLGTP